MPELPEITVYAERLSTLAGEQELQRIRLASPFALRTVEPPPESFAGRALVETDRIGKRVVLGFYGERFAVIHLMLSGRLRWRAPGAAMPRRTGILAFDFGGGSLVLTEASTRHRASLHLVSGREGLAQFDRGGVDLLATGPEQLAASLRRRNRTLKRALTDPAVVDGIGNAYSDEILHRARLSPFALTAGLGDDEVLRLHAAGVATLNHWIARLREAAGAGLPDEGMTRVGMAVHGKYGQRCPVCGAPVQRIVYAGSEANYCPGCQTGGRILADRSLSRLLKDDWPRTIEELEGVRPSRG